MQKVFPTLIFSPKYLFCTKTLYGRLGGEAAIKAASTKLYDKIYADSTVNGFFKNSDKSKQIKLMSEFLAAAFGGPSK
jgi:hemoglobin